MTPEYEQKRLATLRKLAEQLEDGYTTKIDEVRYQIIRQKGDDAFIPSSYRSEYRYRVEEYAEDDGEWGWGGIGEIYPERNEIRMWTRKGYQWHPISIDTAE